MNRYRFDYSPKTKPYPHQVEAINFIKDKEVVPLFDEQGLGKSKIVIDALCEDMRNDKIDGALIVCKKHLIPTWEEEIRMHSHLKHIVLRGTKKEKGSKFMVFANFYIINYELVIQEIERLRMFLKIKRLAIVLDESQRIKNPNTETAKCIFELAPLSIKRVIITGTPIADRPEDIWAQFYFLDQGKTLGEDYDDFKKKYGINLRGKMILRERVKRYDSLKKILSKVSIRRLKDEVLELPEKRYKDVWVEIEGKQKEMYDKLKNELIIEIKNMNGQQIIDESSNILKKLLRLTQIASNPNLVDDDYKGEPAKFKKLDKIVQKIMQKKEKVIIWTSFIKNIRKLRRRYSNFGALMLFGELPIDQRKLILDKFKNDNNYKVLIANPSVAREGLTLTSANNAVYVDRNFILADYLQSQDRIHRITQTKPCNIIKIMARDTIDEYIDEILFKKQKIAQYIQGDIKNIKEEKEYLDREALLRILG